MKAARSAPRPSAALRDPDGAARRCWLAMTAASVAAGAAGCAAIHQPAREHNRHVVLVHGAWYGGWCWRKLRPLLEQAGFEVHVPTLTGLGDRAHRGLQPIDLDMHVQDLVRYLELEDLRDVRLVGHSYGGFVISALAGRSAARLRSLVYVDAFVPDAGTRVIDYLLPLDRREAIVRAGERDGVVPPVPAQILGVTDPVDLEWIASRVVPQPYATFSQRIGVVPGETTGVARTYVACTRPASGSFGQFADRLRGQPSWHYREMQTGHMAMITAPRALADILIALE